MKNREYSGNFNGNGTHKTVFLSEIKRARHGRDQMPVLCRIWMVLRDLAGAGTALWRTEYPGRLHNNHPVFRTSTLVPATNL
jgi:hypothetical protein